MDKELISKIMSDIAKAGHKKNPRSKEFYQNMGKKSGLARKKNKKNLR